MDPLFLDYYNRELTYMRELGAEFAAQFPKIAGRLGMNGVEVLDPYVERLLEGFSFLSARIHLKMDAEFPRFCQRLLEVVCPAYIAPTPSMGIVRFTPGFNEGSLNTGFCIPRDSSLRSKPIGDDKSVCEFRTAHDVILWPIEITSVEFTGAPADIPLHQFKDCMGVKSALRIKLQTMGGADFSAFSIDKLTFYLSGTNELMSKLYEHIFTSSAGVVVTAIEKDSKRFTFLDPSAIKPEGFSDEQSLLPYPNRAFQGHRLLHEYFALPERFRFFTLFGLKCVQDAQKEIELCVLFNRAHILLEQSVNCGHLELFCTPAINLFPKRTDRLLIETRFYEQHVVVDKTRPMDYEIYSVDKVTGFSSGNIEEKIFRPLYESLSSESKVGGAYYILRRELRRPSEKVRLRGARAAYIGSEAYLSLVDQNEAPYATDLRQLSLEALCTNRDLPLLMPFNRGSDFMLSISAPVKMVKMLAGPSQPCAPIADREMNWRLISHLHLNYLTLTDLDESQGAEALRELLRLYEKMGDGASKMQIDSLRTVKLKPIIKRLPHKGPIILGRGIEVSVNVDEEKFSGASPFLFAAVLSRFFGRHVAINHFTETALYSLQRGLIHQWRALPGKRPVA
jgi:type VI secretion system protein ImpG